MTLLPVLPIALAHKLNKAGTRVVLDIDHNSGSSPAYSAQLAWRRVVRPVDPIPTEALVLEDSVRRAKLSCLEARYLPWRCPTLEPGLSARRPGEATAPLPQLPRSHPCQSQ